MMSTAILVMVTLTMIFYALVIWFLVRLVRAHPSVLADIAPSVFGWLRGPHWFKRGGDPHGDRTLARLVEQGRV